MVPFPDHDFFVLSDVVGPATRFERIHRIGSFIFHFYLTPTASLPGHAGSYKVHIEAIR